MATAAPKTLLQSPPEEAKDGSLVVVEFMETLADPKTTDAAVKFGEAIDESEELLQRMQKAFIGQRDLLEKVFTLAKKFRPISEEARQFMSDLKSFADEANDTYLDLFVSTLEEGDVDSATKMLVEASNHLQSCTGKLQDVKVNHQTVAAEVTDLLHEARLESAKVEETVALCDQFQNGGYAIAGGVVATAAVVGTGGVGAVVGAGAVAVLGTAKYGKANQLALLETSRDLERDLGKINAALTLEIAQLSSISTSLDTASKKTDTIKKFTDKISVVKQLVKKAKAHYQELSDQCQKFLDMDRSFRQAALACSDFSKLKHLTDDDE